MIGITVESETSLGMATLFLWQNLPHASLDFYSMSTQLLRI